MSNKKRKEMAKEPQKIVTETETVKAIVTNGHKVTSVQKAVFTRRVFLNRPPCPVCYDKEGGTGLVRKRVGRVQYVYCDRCNYPWKNVIPDEVPMDIKSPAVDIIIQQVDDIQKRQV